MKTILFLLFYCTVLQGVSQNKIPVPAPAKGGQTLQGNIPGSLLKYGDKHNNYAAKTAANDTFTVSHNLGAQDTSGYYMWDFNWNYSQEDELKWALTLFDTLHDSQGNPKAYSMTESTKIDSIFVLFGHKKTSPATVLDSITIEVFNFTLGQFVWDTIIVTNAPLHPSNNWLQTSFLSVPCGHILNPNEKFAIRVGFAGPVNQDTFGILVGYRDGGPCGATPNSAIQSLIPYNTYRLYSVLDTSFTALPVYAYDFLYPNPNWNGIFYRDCNGNSLYDAGSNEEEFFQSAFIFADVIIGTFQPVLPPVANFQASSTYICTNDCINFMDMSTNNPTSWQWSFPGATPNSSTSQTPANICYSATGSYDVTLTVTNSAGTDVTTYTGFIVVTNTPVNPTVSVSPANAICMGNTATLSVSNICSGCTYNWQPSGQTGSSIQVTSAGNYSVTLNSSCGTANSNPVTITVDQATTPSIQVVPSPNLCQGQTATLSISSPCVGCTYAWSPSGQTGPSIQVTTAGAHTVALTNACGTFTSNPVNITVSSTPSPTVTISAQGPMNVCQGQSVVLFANGASQYVWSNGTPGNVLVLTSSGTYTVTGTDMNGCSGVSGVANVTVSPLPPVPVITVNGNVLSSSSAAGNQWHLNSVAIPGANQQTHTATQSGLYYVTVTDVNNCTSQSAPVNLLLNSLDQPLEGLFYVYPNPGSGLFSLYFPQALPDVYLEVYDITAKKVYQSRLGSIPAAYTGQLNLNELPSGIYQLIVTSENQSYTLNLSIQK